MLVCRLEWDGTPDVIDADNLLLWDYLALQTSTPNYKDLLVVDRSLQLEAGMTLEWSPVTHFSKDPLYL